MDPFKDTDIVFGDFGEYIFRIPVEKEKFCMVAVYDTPSTVFKRDERFREHLRGDIDPRPPAPAQSYVMVHQDPHGSGKTYSIAQMILRTDLPEYEDKSSYDTFVICAKEHSKKDVNYLQCREQISRYEQQGFMTDVNIEEFDQGKKIIIKFTRANGKKVMCVWGSLDFLMFRFRDKAGRSRDPFLQLVHDIAEHGATKLKGNKNTFDCCGYTTEARPTTLFIVDEASLPREDYALAFLTLLRLGNLHLLLAGDLQQSEYNRTLMRYFEDMESRDGMNPREDKRIRVVVQRGNKVRRFNEKLVAFRNELMKEFHEADRHNLKLPLPEAVPGVVPARGEVAWHILPPAFAKSEYDEEAIQLIVDDIIKETRKHMFEGGLPGDVLLLTPWVSNCPLFDAINAAMHDLMSDLYVDEEYQACVKNVPGYEEYRHHFDPSRERAPGEVLPWFSYFHRTENGSSIDLKTSQHSARLVSIKTSQGDGRKFVFVVGLTEQKLAIFCDHDKESLKYESMFNVAHSRMKEVLHIYMMPKRDDVYKRYASVQGDFQMPDDLKDQCAPDDRGFTTKITIKDVMDLEQDQPQPFFEDAYDRLEPYFTQEPSPLVEYEHHTIRMAAAHTVFLSKLLVRQVRNDDKTEQIYQKFKDIANCEVEVMDRKDYYRELYRRIIKEHGDPPRKIAILRYTATGSGVFKECMEKITKTIREVQGHVKAWFRGEDLDPNTFHPMHAVALQYALAVLNGGGEDAVKMDSLYEVADCYLRTAEDASSSKMQNHYDYLQSVGCLFDKVVQNASNDEWSWKIGRQVELGGVNGNQLPFPFLYTFHHLFLHGNVRMPVQLCPEVTSIRTELCDKALLFTLFCEQPMKKKAKLFSHTSTSEYLLEKEITKICFVPVKANEPFVVDVTDIVNDYKQDIALWLETAVRQKCKRDLELVDEIVAYNEMHNTDLQYYYREVIEESNCFPFIKNGFKEAEAWHEVKELVLEEFEKDVGKMNKRVSRKVFPNNQRQTEPLKFAAQERRTGVHVKKFKKNILTRAAPPRPHRATSEREGCFVEVPFTFVFVCILFGARRPKTPLSTKCTWSAYDPSWANPTTNRNAHCSTMSIAGVQ